MNTNENLVVAKIVSAPFQRRAASTIVEFEAAMRNLAEDWDDDQVDRMRSAAEAIMKLAARVLIELE